MSKRATNRSPAVIAYLRVSTEEQVASGAGLDAQRATIAQECERRGVELAATYEDAGASGKSLGGRLALAEALHRLATGEASVLIVAKLDRLARSVADFATLVRQAESEGWAILACDLGLDMTTPTGGLLANVTASVAEWERQVIAQRTREALAAKRAAGVRLGRPRLLDPSVADEIHRSRASGETLQAIANRLNATGITTPSGKNWSPTLVRKVALQRSD